jgi:hypothetical protein
MKRFNKTTPPPHGQGRTGPELELFFDESQTDQFDNGPDRGGNDERENLQTSPTHGVSQESEKGVVHEPQKEC